MKLTTRLVLTLLTGVMLLLVVDGYLAARREIALFEDDMERDARMVGLSLRAILGEAFAMGQEARARRLIDDVNQHAGSVRIRWIPSGSDSEPSHADDASGEPPAPESLIRSVWMRGAENALHTFVPVHALDGDLLGNLEIVESRDLLRQYVRNTIIRRAALVVVLLVISASVVSLVGVAVVGRPLQQLIDHTRRIGAGDLTAGMELSGHGELDELSSAMNKMVEQLRASRDELQRETGRRIAAIEQLRHADRLRTVGHLASGIAHELGTPLNVVSGRATMIAERYPGDEEVTECAQIIRAQVERMTGIVRQLLDYARRPKTERTPVDIRKCTTQVVRLLSPLADKKGLALVTDATGGSPLAMADRSQIEQVVTNLTINAIHATPAGCRIELSVAAETVTPPTGLGAAAGRYVCIRVHDNGPGIPENVIEHIFEPFFTTKNIGEGTGLGLSVVDNIIREHGGWVAVRNQAGGGAEFSVYLPEAHDDGA